VLEITVKDSSDSTDKFLSKLAHGGMFDVIDSYAQRGAEALSSATPVESGATAASWSYEIQRNGRDVSIFWTNNHLDSEGTPIAVMLQFGHGTGTGGYVQGRDYINPAIQPIMDQIADAVWREVES
jgi:hypothetical protein